MKKFVWLLKNTTKRTEGNSARLKMKTKCYKNIEKNKIKYLERIKYNEKITRNILQKFNFCIFR